MKRKATQIAVPIVGAERLDVKELTKEYESSMNDLNEKLGDGWKIFFQLIQSITTSQLILCMFLLKLRLMKKIGRKKIVSTKQVEQ